MIPPHRGRPFEVAPLHGLLYDLGKLNGDPLAAARAVTAPPYDVISPEEHGKLLAASPHNIARITLGEPPGSAPRYEERARLLGRWVHDGILVRAAEPCIYVYSIEYTPPGAERGRPPPGNGSEAPASPPSRLRFIGWTALGRLHPFEDGVVLPHERTFPKVVDDRLRLLEATRTHLESIFLLYSDPARSIDRILESQCAGQPSVEVEAKPGEIHRLHAVSDLAVIIKLTDFMSRQRPIIADGHHRYTTGLRFLSESRAAGRAVPGSAWQLMTFTNLHGAGLSILGTHRLLKLAGNAGPERVRAAVERVLSRLDRADGEDRELTVETRDGATGVRFPARLREPRRGVARTAYALLHDVVIGEWLRDLAGGEGQGASPESGIRYFKEGTGETDALARGEGDILFRMKPVEPREFQEVVQGGEVFPHKTTYFYPKLWSGLVLWPIEEPERLALK
jgi:uncharacterized protein (DUF1015 family)